MSTAEIQRMSNHERLAAMEQLWDALCHGESEPSSPDWHKTVLTTRKEKMDSGQAQFLTLDQVRDRFR